MGQVRQASTGTATFVIRQNHAASTCCLKDILLCSHSNTPVDELLGKPYQDEMLALIESCQDPNIKADSDPPDNTINDDSEFDEADPEPSEMSTTEVPRQ